MQRHSYGESKQDNFKTVKQVYLLGMSLCSLLYFPAFPYIFHLLKNKNNFHQYFNLLGAYWYSLNVLFAHFFFFYLSFPPFTFFYFYIHSDVILYFPFVKEGRKEDI